MFPQQTLIAQAVSTLNPLIARYPGWQSESPQWLEEAEQKANDFFVPVPLVGAFSAGKSSLINAMLGTPLLSAEITPETAVPAELRHSDTECLMGRTKDGQRIAVSREAIEANELGALCDGGVLELALSIPNLATMPHIQLVDMPGWDSNSRAHSAAIDGYAPRALAYGVVVSAAEGTLHQSIRDALLSLKTYQKPVFAIISKTDQKPAEDVDAIAKLVEQEIEKTLGTPPFMTIKTSARKRQVTDLLKALQWLEDQSEILFAQSVAQGFQKQLLSLQAHIQILHNSDDLHSEAITAKRESLQNDMAAFTQKLNAETQQLDAKIPIILRHFEMELKNALEGDLDSLARHAANGGELSVPIGTTTRQCLEKIMREDFADGMNAYLGNIALAMPSSLAVPSLENQQTSADSESSSSLHVDKLTGALKSAAATAAAGAALGSVVPVIGTAIGATVGALLGGVISFFGGGSSKAEHLGSKVVEDPQAQERARIQNIKEQLLSRIIPEVVSQGRESVRPILLQHVQRTQQAISAQVEAKQRSTQAALETLQSQLAQSQTVREQAQAQYHADLSVLQNMQTALNSAIVAV